MSTNAFPADRARLHVVAGAAAATGPLPEAPLLRRPEAASVGLWSFLGVATSLFSLFTLAFALRMNGSDWSSIEMPRQLWLSTAVLALGSLVLHRAGTAARRGDLARARSLMRGGGLCAAAFLVVQAWAWQALLAGQVGLTANPAASFFFLLTAMHGLHVAGGLVGWTLALRALRSHAPDARPALFVALIARYWHFLFAVWVVLFGALGWLSPELVRYLCGTA